MPHLKISFEEARQIGEALNQAARDNHDQLQSLSPRVNPDGVFEGEAATRYRELYDRYRSAENELNLALGDLGTAMRQIIDRFDEINRNGFA